VRHVDNYLGVRGAGVGTGASVDHANKLAVTTRAHRSMTTGP
jgi:hypothetical protein